MEVISGGEFSVRTASFMSSSSKLDMEPTATFKAPTAADIDLSWSPARQYLATVFVSMGFDLAVGVVVAFNMILVVLETDARAGGKEELPTWIPIANNVLLTIYFVEVAAKMVVFRCLFFKSPKDVVDFCIILLDIVTEIMESLLTAADDKDIMNGPTFKLLLATRFVRFGRALRFLTFFPELQQLLYGLVGALHAIAWGSMLVVLALGFWSTLAVQIIHPLNLEIAETGYYDDIGCERCARAFSSTFQALITFTQHILAGDSWGQVSIPVIEKYPATILFFVGVLVSVSVAIMNLILAVIVDSAQEARQSNIRQQVAMKEAQRKAANERFLKLCEEIDSDGSGSLSLDELKSGYESNGQFKDIMDLMDIQQADMEIVFCMLDSDTSGTVDYKEFAEQLHRMKSHDAHALLVFIKYYVMEIRTKVTEQVNIVRRDIVSRIDKITPFPGPPKEDAPVLETDAGTHGDELTRTGSAKEFQTKCSKAEPSESNALPDPLREGKLDIMCQDAQGSIVKQATEELQRVMQEIVAKLEANQELTHVMRQMVEKSEVHTRLLSSLHDILPMLACGASRDRLPDLDDNAPSVAASQWRSMLRDRQQLMASVQARENDARPPAGPRAQLPAGCCMERAPSCKVERLGQHAAHRRSPS